MGRLAFQSLCAPQCMQSCTVGILYLLQFLLRVMVPAYYSVNASVFRIFLVLR